MKPARICGEIAKVLSSVAGFLIVFALFWQSVDGAGGAVGFAFLAVMASPLALIVGTPCGILASLRTRRRGDILATVFCVACYPISVVIIRVLGGGR